VRRYGWLHAFAGFAVSAPLCIDQRDLEPLDSPKRHLYNQRVDQLIPNPTTFTATLFLAAFYPEIVHLIALFCAPAWRNTAMQATRSDTHLTTIATGISQVIGREPRPYEPAGPPTTMWIRALRSMPPNILPLRTFAQSRRASLDGVPSPNQPSRPDEKRKIKVLREFRKHRHIPAWTLPRNVRWPDDIHQPRTVLGLAEPPHGWS
jgi:hypothetical protein